MTVDSVVVMNASVFFLAWELVRTFFWHSLWAQGEILVLFSV